MSVSQAEINYCLAHDRAFTVWFSLSASFSSPVFSAYHSKFLCFFKRVGAQHYPSLPTSLPTSLHPFFSHYFFWGVNTHTKLPSLSSVTAATARQRNTIHDRVVQIGRCFTISHEEGERLCELGSVKKKKKRKEKKGKKEVPCCWRKHGSSGWSRNENVLVWLSAPVGFNPFDITRVPSVCLSDNVLAWSEARVATVGRGGDLDRLWFLSEAQRSRWSGPSYCNSTQSLR